MSRAFLPLRDLDSTIRSFSLFSAPPLYLYILVSFTGSYEDSSIARSQLDCRESEHLPWWRYALGALIP